MYGYVFLKKKKALYHRFVSVTLLFPTNTKEPCEKEGFHYIVVLIVTAP